MKTKPSFMAKALCACILFLAAKSSHAGLVLLSAENFSGTGLGSANTILTIQGRNNNAFESGGVVFTAGGDVITGADTKTGASQSLTRSLGSLGLDSASALRVVFNASEPDSKIDLTALTLTIYSPTGTSLFSTGLNMAYNNLNTLSGVGNSGFVFGLDAASAALAQAAVFSLPGFAGARVGLSASAASFGGGVETFFIAPSADEVVGIPQQVPEPGSLALLGLGLAGVGVIHRGKHRH